ncbi:MAG: ferrochelatase [Planctomycetota bacterium]|nr:MAG: ferrochelatase [Planctomycetota bacterium]
MAQYDAIFVVSFGGPEGPDDVMPFLENVLRGKNVPRERMLEVAEHYRHFDGVSPINNQNRALIAALEAELAAKGPQLPIYWGNRNWHPTLPDTLRQMAADGIRRAIAFFTSAYSSYSGCRQYRENIAVAREEVGPEAPEVDKLRVFFNHPGFIEPNVENLRAALEQIPAARRDAAAIVYTAHSIPSAMADNCRYAAQLEDACRTVSEAVGRDAWRLVYQSRSGPPQQPWLEPDIGDYLRELRAGGATDAVVLPIGFISDHLEVIWDLDTEAQEIAGEIGLNMVRAATVGVHPRFITMIRELVEERMNDAADRPAVGRLGPSHDVCPQDCCLYTPRRPTG